MKIKTIIIFGLLSSLKTAPLRGAAAAETVRRNIVVQGNFSDRSFLDDDIIRTILADWQTAILRMAPEYDDSRLVRNHREYTVSFITKLLLLHKRDAASFQDLSLEIKTDLERNPLLLSIFETAEPKENNQSMVRLIERLIQLGANPNERRLGYNFRWGRQFESILWELAKDYVKHPRHDGTKKLSQEDGLLLFRLLLTRPDIDINQIQPMPCSRDNDRSLLGWLEEQSQHTKHLDSLITLFKEHGAESVRPLSEEEQEALRVRGPITKSATFMPLVPQAAAPAARANSPVRSLSNEPIEDLTDDFDDIELA